MAKHLLNVHIDDSRLAMPIANFFHHQVGHFPKPDSAETCRDCEFCVIVQHLKSKTLADPPETQEFIPLTVDVDKFSSLSNPQPIGGKTKRRFFT